MYAPRVGKAKGLGPVDSSPHNTLARCRTLNGFHPHLKESATANVGATGAAGFDFSTVAVFPPNRVSTVNHVVEQHGTPLDDNTRRFMEDKLGHDFGSVRVHTGKLAVISARAMNALAYTVGRDIVFDSGQYAPETEVGRRLIAHELAHTIQQGFAHVSSPASLRIAEDESPSEREAQAASRLQTTGSPPVFTATTPAIARQQPAPQPTPAQIYGQALTSLKAADPEIHKLVSPASLDGAAVSVRKGTAVDNSVSPPVTLTFDFTLEVKSGGLATGQTAAFTPGNVQLGGSGQNRTLSAPMTIKINPGTGSSAASDLATSLFHEGLHMLLFMEDLLPSSPANPRATALANYQKIYRGHKDYSLAWAELDIYIDTDLKSRKQTIPITPDLTRKWSKEILDHIIEEKYVFDQEKSKFGTKFTNAALVESYLKDAFPNFGVKFVKTDKNLNDAIQKLTGILDDVDRQVKPAAPTPTPTTPPPQGKPTKP